MSKKPIVFNQQYICEGCGEVFTPVRSDKRYCTKRCYDNFFNRAMRIKKRNSSLFINEFGTDQKSEITLEANLEGLTPFDRCLRYLSMLQISKDGTEFPYEQFKSANFDFMAFSNRYKSSVEGNFYTLEFGEFEIIRTEKEILLVKYKLK
jgi:hypothetical protein